MCLHTSFSSVDAFLYNSSVVPGILCFKSSTTDILYLLSNGTVADIVYFRSTVADILNSEVSNENKVSITPFYRPRIPVIFFIDPCPWVVTLSLNDGMYEYEYNV